MNNNNIHEQDWKGIIMYGSDLKPYNDESQIWITIYGNADVQGVIWDKCYSRIRFSDKMYDKLSHYVKGEIKGDILKISISKAAECNHKFEDLEFEIEFDANGKLFIKDQIIEDNATYGKKVRLLEIK